MLIAVKKFEFEAAHHLPNYDGPCKNVHGHTYKLEVGITRNDDIDLEDGMIIDFKILKVIIKKNMVDILDHSNLNDFLTNPTCENLIIFIRDRLFGAIMGYPLSLVYIKLHETSDSYCEWRKD